MNFLRYSSFLKSTGKLIYLAGAILNRLANKSKLYIEAERNRLTLQLAAQQSFSISADDSLFYLTNAKSQLVARRNTSDLQVFHQIFVNQEYFSVIDLFTNNNWKLETMIDAGANVGYTMAYIKERFADCKVVCLEPFTSNFTTLQQNLQSKLNCHPLNKALWSHTAQLFEQRTFRDNKEWSIQFSEQKNASTPIEAISIDDVMKTYFPNENIDFIKIDIEGGEFNVFDKTNDMTWLNCVNVLALEIHDECGDRTKINAILIDHGFFFYRVGELTVAIKKNLIEK